MFTPAHYDIALSSKLQPLDINGDGVPDFAFNHGTGGLSNYHSDFLDIIPLGGGVMALTSGWNAALSKGAAIGSSANFATGTREMAVSAVYGYSYHHKFFGPWSSVRNRYLGVSFTLDGQTHYGWIRLDVSDYKYPLKAIVTGYAYETTPDKSIRAGQTSGNDDQESQVQDPLPLGKGGPSLGMLAAGADFLSGWRRDEDASQAA